MDQPLDASRDGNSMTFSSQKGFSLVQTVIVLALSTIVGVGMASVIKDSYYNSKRAAVQSMRLMAINNIRFSSGNFIAMNKSALENRKKGTNSQLVSCVCGKSNCATNVKYDVGIYDVSGVPLAGTLAAPRYYNTQGDRCDQDQEGCILQATAQFTCIGTNCGDASAMTDSDPVLRISYSLKPIANKDISGLGPMPEVKGPDIDITAKSIRNYALENSLCVQISSFSPNVGFVTGGEEIVFQGGGLMDVNQVYIGGQVCPIIAQANLSLSCRAPAASEGLYDVLVAYGNTENPETILLPQSYAYNPVPAGGGNTNTCLWQPKEACSINCDKELPFFPPCFQGNRGERINVKEYIYECSC
ncbi:IPT/TIG domain-containing protein [Bdellovibrio sp. 22V]|uniref:IPT/TIG domain-containing protein n=1 Tax=Bdellovibrio TaxID=958 RepID=UPI002542AB55|nr:IPT/TIG domain-containing protein [Bdellovibrio sp. 22V]WII73393.1 IPT/TIG domain-containing protein [Bdellovibrio sp. 22V]